MVSKPTSLTSVAIAVIVALVLISFVFLLTLFLIYRHRQRVFKSPPSYLPSKDESVIACSASSMASSMPSPVSPCFPVDSRSRPRGTSGGILGDDGEEAFCIDGYVHGDGGEEEEGWSPIHGYEPSFESSISNQPIDFHTGLFSGAFELGNTGYTALGLDVDSLRPRPGPMSAGSFYTLPSVDERTEQTGSPFVKIPSTYLPTYPPLSSRRSVPSLRIEPNGPNGMYRFPPVHSPILHPASPPHRSFSSKTFPRPIIATHSRSRSYPSPTDSYRSFSSSPTTTIGSPTPSTPYLSCPMSVPSAVQRPLPTLLLRTKALDLGYVDERDRMNRLWEEEVRMRELALGQVEETGWWSFGREREAEEDRSPPGYEQAQGPLTRVKSI